MFIYKLNSIEKLLTVAKNREYVQNNPELCKLLENPLIKDDTELAIHYNEYKLNYPDSAKKFVDYFYMHGPELDVGSLDEWRTIIQNDPELLEEANKNDCRIDEIWAEKQANKEKNYSWSTLADLYDCLSKPCQYTNMISPSIGTIGDNQPKYNLKNTSGSDEAITLLGIPAYMINKMPRYLLQGITQLTDMISLQSSDIFNKILGSKKAVKEDPYILKDVETIGGDVLGAIASRMGDCFRLYEYKRRYNPYNYEQNMTRSDRFGTVVYDENGNPHVKTPNGNSMESKTTIFSDNSRLNPNVSINDIRLKNIGEVSQDNTLPIKITAYNPVFLPDGRYYIDANTSDYDNVGIVSGTNESGIRLLPNSASGIEQLSKENKILHVGCATRPKDVIKYYQAFLIKNYPNLSLPKNFSTLVSRAIKYSDLNVVLFFPNGQRVLPVFDTGGGQPESPWIDITAQYFFTKEGWGLATIYDSSGKAITSDANNPMPELLASSELSKAKIQPYKIKAMKINGAPNNNGIINGKYFFSESFCQTNGLDPQVYAQVDQGARLAGLYAEYNHLLSN